MTGEPLGLDLLNTRWVNRGRTLDLLADLAGLRQWQLEAALAEPAHPVTPVALQAVLLARDAIQRHIQDPTSPDACIALNDVLAWGHTEQAITPDGPSTTTHVDDAEQSAAWHAAANYVDLITRDRGRVRKCARAGCGLYFLDTSPRATRRWCSMELCGNRAKASRHYARAKRPHDAPGSR